ncbi:MAG: molecular chaperone HtpG [Gammaproteobacteria bacterium]|nr:molecular chaperone HtpG [Gammaproteobacteria bacterium]MCY4219903.1 molecular chaperone HtpG [Gammaproteobacteria bacterium]MCY4274013.1 molecular chaperone HtpG [Gammaproteobacteria bacterium]
MSPKTKSESKSKKARTSTLTSETRSFQAEVKQLLNLMIHSLYSNKEIFLRELISNASDACDKLRFASLTDKTLLEDEEDLGIWISADQEKKTIIIRDNGIGMDYDEVVEDIGTIARSGTRAFIEKMESEKSSGNADFIGQFGVGFYSCFLVGKQVTLITRKAGTESKTGVMWSSDGTGEYTISSIDRPNRGTEIIIHLKDDDDQYVKDYRIRSIIEKYSDHISIPILMPKEPEPVTEESEGDEKPESKPEEGEQWEVVNRGSALWARPKKEISEEEYTTFYSSLSYDSTAPVLTIHNRVEGKLDYISLFFVPATAPFDLWDREQRQGIKLYVRRIFISDDAKTLMPNYLRFVRGLVDCADLPLNVSREFLQQNRDIDKIRQASVKRVLGELKKLSESDNETYNKIWKEFGKVLKEGVVEDHENRKSIAELARFSTTKGDGESQTVSLNQYVDRMPMSQKHIYYLTAESHMAASSSPHLEIFKKKDIEVLLLSDPVDEWFVSHFTEFRDKALKSIARGDLELDDIKEEETEKKTEEEQAAQNTLIQKIKEVLDETVKDVRFTNRLVDSPSCLIADEMDMGGNMERILKAIGQEAPTAKPILEINPDHTLIKRMDPEGEELEDWAKLLFDQALLAEGATLNNPGEFVKRVNRLLIL